MSNVLYSAFIVPLSCFKKVLNAQQLHYPAPKTQFEKMGQVRIF